MEGESDPYLCYNIEHKSDCCLISQMLTSQIHCCSDTFQQNSLISLYLRHSENLDVVTVFLFFKL